MPRYKIVLNIESEMGDPNKWDWETLLITDPDVETIIDVIVMDAEKVLNHLPENEEVYECLDDDCGWGERKYHWYMDEIPTECEDCDGAIKEGTMDYDI